RSRATSGTGSPSSISLRAWAICGAVSFGLRPNFTPRRSAALTPARVRSVISERSSSASTPIICHMARPVGVSVSIASVSDPELDALLFEAVQHMDEVAQAAAQTVELPHNQCVAGLQLLQATGEGRAFDVSASHLVLEHGFASGLFQSRELHGGILVFGADAGIAIFHAFL